MTDRVDGPNHEEPDPRLLWRWAGKATRPWIGWVFIGASLLFALLGYLGVSREVVVSKQIPYLVSGGITAVILAVVGTYFLGTEELRKDSGRLDRLEEMVADVHAALLDLRQPSRPASAGAEATNGDGPTEVVIVEGGEHFHRASCSMADGKVVEQITREAAGARSLRACPLCDPIPTG